mgnify:FL=1
MGHRVPTPLSLTPSFPSLPSLPSPPPQTGLATFPAHHRLRRLHSPRTPILWVRGLSLGQADRCIHLLSPVRVCVTVVVAVWLALVAYTPLCICTPHLL